MRPYAFTLPSVLLACLLLFVALLTSTDADVIAGPLGETAVIQQLHAQPANNLANTIADWKVIGEQPDANFGVAVTFAGDLNNDGYADAIIGEDWHDGDYPHQGKIFIHLGSAFGLNPSFDFAITLLAENANYGYAVAPAGDLNNDGYADFLVGAPGYSSVQGLVMINFGAADGLDITLSQSLMGQTSGEQFGSALAAGDVNGDGYPDILVGAPGRWLGSSPDAGAAYLFYGGPTGINTTPAWTLLSDQGGSRLGQALAVGDFNDDGYADVAVGAGQYDNDATQNGAVFLFYGSSQGFTSAPVATSQDAHWVAYGSGNDHRFGMALAAGGSVNGDEFSDLIVGAPGYNDGATGPWGAAYGYFGSEIGLNTWANWFITEYEPGSMFGHSVAIIGDLDQDGFDDVLVGSPMSFSPGGFLADNEPPGTAYFYLGSNNGLGYYWNAYITNDVSGSRFGHALAGGDANGDELADLLIGAPRYPQNGQAVGAVYSYFGGRELVGLTAVNDSPTSLGQPTSFAAFLDSGALAQFDWSFGDGNYASGQFVQHTYALPGVYTATVYANNPFNSLSATTTVVVNVGSVIDPETGGVLEFFAPTGWGISVQVPGGAVEAPVGLVFIPLDPNEIEEPLPPNASTYFFDLNAVDPPLNVLYLPLIVGSAAGGGPLVAAQPSAPADNGTFPFLLPITVTLTYTDNQIPGLDEQSLILTYWDGSAWVDAATTCPDPFPYVRDPANNQITLQICHLTRFGLIGGT